MDRIMVFNRLDAYLFDLDPKQVHDLRSVEEVNGEHALTITTTHQLEKTNRIVLKDGMGHWHEYVVTGIVDSHETDEGLVTEYYCVWSIQYDLSGTFVNNQYGCGIVPGHESVPHPVQDGLAIALSTTNRWQIGTVNVTSMAAASFYRRSGWEAIQTVIEKWGGELQATIDVGQGGVVARRVDLLEHVGASSATRRFDYGHDVASIKRTVSDEVWPCRIIPLGASQETDEGGYTRRPTIESVNSGVMWLEDADAVPLTRMPDGNGGWEYPTVIVENDTYEVPADLKAWAIANITDYTRPRVTYEASVVQLARAGMNPHGVALGDEVVVVDREFGSDGLRITARVVRQECNLLDPTDTVLTIGNITDKLSGQLADLSRQVSEVAEQVANASSYQSSTEYVSRLLERINNEANATGGFTYITEGQGIRTYDVAVSDPLVGAEASAVVEIKGGTVRIANTKDSSGQWEWKTIFTSGYVNAEVIRAIGMLSGNHVEVDANGVHIFDSMGKVRAAIGETITLGNAASGSVVTIDNTGMVMSNGNIQYFDVQSDGASVDVEVYQAISPSVTMATIYSGSSAKTRTYNVPSDVIASHDGEFSITFDSVTYNRNGNTWTHEKTVQSYAVGTSSTASIKVGATSTVMATVSYDGDSAITASVSAAPSSIPSYVTHWLDIVGVRYMDGIPVPAYSLGNRFGDAGRFSAIIGDGLIAASDSQTAIGKFNVSDPNNTYVLIVGNGTDDDHRSNALVVGWDGNVMAQAMAGIVQMFAGATPPSGWLECNGQAVSRTTYAVLFAAIGTTWGAGDGSTTFNVPDLRGRGPIGAGTGSGLTARTLGNSGGSESIQSHTHGFTNPKIPNHVHTMAHHHTSVSSGRALQYNYGTITTGVGRVRVAAASSGSYYVPYVGNASVDFSGLTNTGDSSAANTGNPTTLGATTGGSVGAVSGATTGSAGNMQPFAVVKFIICTGKTS